MHYPCEHRPRPEMGGPFEISNYDTWLRLGNIGTRADFLASLKGEKGDQGNGLIILGSYDSIADLEAAITEPKVGDVYAVGEEEPFDIYFWNGTENEWTSLGTLEGPPGEGFTILGHYDDLAELEAAITAPAAGDAYSIGATEPYTVYVWNETDSTWDSIGSIQGPAGEDGKSVELRLYSGYIQWRPTDGSWANLVPLTDITGPSGDDGKSVELQVTSTHIQWRQEGGSWANLVALTDITGPTGQDGGYYSPSVNGAGVLSWTGSKAGMPAVSSSNIKGPQGTQGPPGTGFQILGYYETLQDLEDATVLLSPAQGDIYGVGAEEPYTFYAYDLNGQEWISLGQIQGPAGADGGYYTPAVDASGNLTWTASEQGMTPVSSSNIKGPTGAAGPNQVTTATDSNVTGILKGNGSKVVAAVAGTDYVIPSGVPAKATNAPQMDGTAAIGNSTKWAAENHVHPSDTSRIPTADKAVANGVATLDNDSLLSKAQSLLRTVSITSNTTLAASHAESLLRVNSSTARTLTIPVDSSNATFPVGTCILVEQVAAGAATVQGASGVYLNGTNGGSVALSAAHTALAIVKVDATHWDCWGAI